MPTRTTDAPAPRGSAAVPAAEPSPAAVPETTTAETTTAETPTGAQALAEQLRSAVLLLARRLRQQDEMSGLTMSQLSALSVVNARGPLTIGELATAERVQPPTITRVVAALEAQGCLAREGDPTDRRLVRVRVTEAGRSAILESRARRTAYLARRIAGLGPQEQEAIAAVLPVLAALQEDHR